MNKIKSLISSAVVFTACLSTSHAEQQLSPEYLAAMERDLGISAAEIPQHMQAEKFAVDVESMAIKQFGESYAGSWMEHLGHGQYKYVVATTDKNTRALDGTQHKSVRYSLKQLEKNMSDLSDLMNKLYESASLEKELADGQADVIQSIYVDVKTNSVVIKAMPGATKAAINFVAKSKVDIDAIRVEEAEGKATALVTTYGGREYISGGGFCSIGFPVTVNGSSAKGFVTAGHCGLAGTSVSISGANIGSVQRANYPGDDMAWASQRSSDSQSPFVTRYNGGSVNDVRVNGSSVAAIGSSVCRSGRTTGYRCGIIQSRNVSVNYGDGLVGGLTQSTACAGRGDSGGSWITPAGQAQGVTSGGSLPLGQTNNCGVSTPVSWFQPVNEILSRYGLSLTR